MKHLILLILPILLLTSCNQTPPEKTSVVEESTQIVGEYVDTLENSVGDARSVVEMMNKKTEKLNGEINK